LTPRELSEYAERERIAITKFFTEFSGEFPKLKMGCEDITNPKRFVETNLERIKYSHKSAEFRAAMLRFKTYRKLIENGTTIS
jgi:hypothetical protein